MALLVGSVVFFFAGSKLLFQDVFRSSAIPDTRSFLIHPTVVGLKCLKATSTTWAGQEFEKDQGPLNTPEKLMTYPPWLIGPFGLCVCVSY